MQEVREEREAGVHACRSVFLRKTAYLERDLDEGAGDEAREDHGAQGVVKEGF